MDKGIGVAHCFSCKEPVPVIEKTIAIDVNDDEKIYYVVACAICYTILNRNANVEIQYYPIEQLKFATRWVASDELQRTEPGET